MKLRAFLTDPAHWIMLILALIGLAFLFAGASPLFAGEAEALKMQTQMLGVTAQLNGNCSATLIWSHRDEKTGEVENVLLTAAHCVTGNKSDMDVDFPVYQANRIVKKDHYIARVRGEWYAGDLALVDLRDKQTFFANVAKIAPEKPPLFMGQDVWTVGYPLGMSLTITRGMFGAFETNDFDKPGTEYFRATPDIAGGNSGGAMYLMNAAGDYQLVGVTAARARNDSFIGLYTPVGSIYSYLKVALPGAVGVKASP